MFSPGDPLLDPLEFERQLPTGRFAPADVEPDRNVPPDRGPDGRFVSPDRVPIENMSRDPLGVYNPNPPGPVYDPMDEELPTTPHGTAVTAFGHREATREAEETALAREDVPLGPEEALRGVGAGYDELTDEGQWVERGGERMGRRPSYQRLSAGAEQALAAGPEADMAFMEAEEQRAREEWNGNGGDVFLEGQSLSVADTAVGWAEMQGVVPEGTRDELEDTNGAELDQPTAFYVADALEGYQEHEQQIADEGRATIMGDPESHQQWADWTQEAREDLEPQLF